MVTIYCVVVGGEGEAFSVEIEDSASVEDLKKVIKEAKPAAMTADLDTVKLFLSKMEEESAWMTQLAALSGVRDTSGYIALPFTNAKLRRVGLAKTQLGEVSEEEDAVGHSPVHVLVKIPPQVSLGKRTRAADWFGSGPAGVQSKRQRMDVDENRIVTYFTMADFPPLMHPMQMYPVVMERNSSVVIFTDLMRKTKEYFELECDANLMVTGNPGAGKSRFYLYCIYQLIGGNQADVQQLGQFELVLNFNSQYHHYRPDKEEFVGLSTEGVLLLMEQKRVLRLIEGNSTMLLGWKGVSILFASPGITGLNDYGKVNLTKYIIPVWTLDELRDYNSVLIDTLKLDDEILTSRYYKFGGIPRYIFTGVADQEEIELNQAIDSFNALDIISFIKSGQAVRDGNYSHRVLEMVPTRFDFRGEFYLDFLSNYIAERIVAKVSEDSLHKVSKFAVAHADDDSGSTAIVRGKIYELLCHKWFTLPKQLDFTLKPLNSCEQPREFAIQNPLTIQRFSTLEEIGMPQHSVYYRPKSKTFGALDAFFIVGSECVALQVTMNRGHGIKSAPLNTFLKWMNGVGIVTNKLLFVFVVPNSIAASASFRSQAITTNTGSTSRKPGDSRKVKQYVLALDVLAERKEG